MLFLIVLGICCAVSEELVSGIIIMVVGVVGAVTLLKVEVAERMMVRRMRRRGEQSSPKRQVA